MPCNHIWKPVSEAKNNSNSNRNGNSNGKYNLNININSNINGNGNGNVNGEKLATATILATTIETEMMALPTVVMDTQDIVVIQQMPLGLHTSGHTERPEITSTLVEHANTLRLVKNEIPH